MRLRVANTHLQHTSAVERRAQTERIVELLRSAKDPVVLVGDLNAEPGAPELAPLWSRFADAWPRGGEGDGFTYPSSGPRARIDYVLTTADVDVEAARTLPSPASDHLQLVADLVLPRPKPERARPFDLQAHRGGLGLVTESTLEAFANALAQGPLNASSRGAADRRVVGHVGAALDRTTELRRRVDAMAREPRLPPGRPRRLPRRSAASYIATSLIAGRLVADPGVHGNPQNGKVGDPGYRPYTTPALVAEAHDNGLAVIPWTIDDEPTMASLMDAGVDGIITDYPDRLRALMAERGLELPRPVREPRGRDCLERS